MLLFSKHIRPGLHFAAWKIEEGEAFFRNDLPLSSSETLEFENIANEGRRLEWLAARWLLHRLTGAEIRMPVAKTAYSKPFFLGVNHLFCSLSHSNGTVAALLSDRNCGCDIQTLTPKMPRIAPRFMRSDELDWVQNSHPQHQYELLHTFWTAKEALYKAYGLKEVDFRQQILIEPFQWAPDQVAATRGQIVKEDDKHSFSLYTGFWDYFVWTVAVE